MSDKPFVSRAGAKLDHALSVFQIDVTGLVGADFGCSTGGFTDCLLQRGASKVFAIDTGYGVLDWKLRNDPRVVVMERTNAIHVSLPQKVRLVTIDASWTRQRIILPPALRAIDAGGSIITLIKPHYEAPPKLLRKGILPDEHQDQIVNQVEAEIRGLGLAIVNRCDSPIKGAKGNREVLALLHPMPPV